MHIRGPLLGIENRRKDKEETETERETEDQSQLGNAVSYKEKDVD